MIEPNVYVSVERIKSLETLGSQDKIFSQGMERTHDKVGLNEFLGSLNKLHLPDHALD